MVRADAVGLFGEDQVARAWRYHRPLYAAAVAQLVLGLLVLALIVFGRLGDWLFEPVRGWPWWAQVVGFTALMPPEHAGDLATRIPHDLIPPPLSDLDLTDEQAHYALDWLQSFSELKAGDACSVNLQWMVGPSDTGVITAEGE